MRCKVVDFRQQNVEGEEEKMTPPLDAVSDDRFFFGFRFRALFRAPLHKGQDFETGDDQTDQIFDLIEPTLTDDSLQTKLPGMESIGANSSRGSCMTREIPNQRK